MRSRITLAAVGMAVLVLLVGGLLWTSRFADASRERDATLLSGQARAMAAALDSDTVTQQRLDDLVGGDVEARYAERGSAPLTATTPGFEAPDADSAVIVTTPVGAGTLTLTAGRAHAPGWLGYRGWTAVGLAVLLVALVGLLGFAVARALAWPFRRLARAGEALSRGRYDLDLPHSRIPEARTLADALRGSAQQLRDRLERDREFGQRTSHELRTPLTSLTLYLEDLVSSEGLPSDSRAAVLGAMRAVKRLDVATGELVEHAARGVLLEGAAVPLRELAAQVAQRWADLLHGSGERRLSAAVEGDLELRFTPGPVEQALDRAFADVVERAPGSVRLVFEGAASRLRVDVTMPDAPRVVTSAADLSTLQTAMSVFGGTVEADEADRRLRIHLPRR